MIVTSMQFLSTKLTAQVATGIILGIFVLIPFHALLTVWIGSAAGSYDATRLWKELLIVVLSLLVLYLLVKSRRDSRPVHTRSLFWIIASYSALHLLWGIVAILYNEVNTTALGYALVVNLRFLVFFVVCWVVAGHRNVLFAHWQAFLLVPALLVVIFGLLQAFVLPADILRHVGYGQDTISPYQTVDQKPEYMRVQSTLRGANPLGAYLVVVVTALLVLLIRKGKLWSKREQVGVGACLISALVVLGSTYSRSAYIGMIIATVTACWLLLGSYKARRVLLIGMVFVALSGTVAVAVLRHNDVFQNTFFHTDEHSGSPRSSNEDRLSALKGGLGDVAKEPLGRGPGTAGPASQHNDHPARIAENYYIQIGQEVGWIGMVLFIVIVVSVLRELWTRRTEILPIVLLASFAGISVINLFWHAWTDDSVSLVWWGLAGIALAILEGDETH